MRQNPFSTYRPGVAVLGSRDNSFVPEPGSQAPKPFTKPSGPPPGTDPMEPNTKPGGWQPEPVVGANPPMQRPANFDRLQNWARGLTTYGRNNAVQNQGQYTVAGTRGVGTGGQAYDGREYGSNYTGPRLSQNNILPNMVGNPNVWNADWMRQYNDYARGLAPPPGFTPPIPMPGGGTLPGGG